MAKYTATSPDGQTITLEGDTPPSESDFDSAFAQAKQYAQPRQSADSGDVRPSGLRDSVSESTYSINGRSQPYSEAAPYYAPPSTIDERPGIDIGRALLTNEPTQGMGEELIRGIPSTLGGLAGATAGAGIASIPLAGLGGMSGESARQGVAQVYAGMTGRPFTPPTEALKSIGIQGAGQAAGQAGGLAVGAIARGGGRVLSQAARAMTGTPEQSASYLLKNPGMKALPIEEAGKLYKSGVGEAAEGSMEAGRSVFGKTYPGPEAAVNTFDEMRGVLEAANPNELLGMRQTMMDTLSDTPVTSPKLRKMLSDRINVLDGLLDTRLPDWGGAKQAWREAKIGEDFGSWLPLNKNLSPNVLRTAGAVAAAASSASKGELLGLAALPLISPKVWGVGLRGVGYAAKAPAVVYRVGTAAGSSVLAQKYGEISRNRIPIPDPAFSAIGGVRPAIP